MSFKAFDLASDVASMVSSVNEVVTISSSLFVTGAGDTYVKKFSNIASASVPLGGYWQTAFDASPAASTSTPLLDFTFGYHSSSGFNVAGSTSASQNEKLKVYREMANSLMGDPDAQFNVGYNAPDCYFVMVKRSLQKDELKKGSVSLNVVYAATTANLNDTNAATSFQQTVGGDYGYLYNGADKVGQVWYNAGVIVLAVSGVFSGTNGVTLRRLSGTISLTSSFGRGTIDECVDQLRTQVNSVAFHNQTNLYSSIYFCRATNAEFNYSSNPTFVDSSKRILVTSGSNILQTRTYITTIGLYDANDNLLAVSKVNKPITKSPDNEATFKVRLDY